MSQMRSSRSLGAGVSTSHLLDGCVASLNTSLDLVNLVWGVSGFESSLADIVSR